MINRSPVPSETRLEPHNQREQRERPGQLLSVSGPGPGSGHMRHERMVSRNMNGTNVMTSLPTNESELQLYRVLQRANL